jgi:ribosomal protein L30E
MNKKVLFVLAALVLVLGFGGIALANDGALADFNAQYPGKSYSCSLCHTSAPTLNPYGADLLANGATGSNINPATFVAVEGLDSDGDGATNLEEITAGTLPGDDTSVPPPPPAAFEVTAPAAAESVPTGAPYNVTWTAATGAASYKVKLSIDNGLTWSTLGTGLSATTVSWNVPNTIKKNISKAIIKVIAYNATNQKLGVAKSGTFSIDVLTITAPTAGQIVPQNAPFNITWTANGTAVAPDQVVVKYSLNNGTTWKTAQGTLGASSFSWNVPAVANPKTKAKVKVILKAVGNTVARAISDKFTVQ